MAKFQFNFDLLFAIDRAVFTRQRVLNLRILQDSGICELCPLDAKRVKIECPFKLHAQTRPRINIARPFARADRDVINNILQGFTKEEDIARAPTAKSAFDFKLAAPTLFRDDVRIANLIITVIEIQLRDKIKEIKLSNLAIDPRIERRAIIILPTQRDAAFWTGKTTGLSLRPGRCDFGHFRAHGDLKLDVVRNRPGIGHKALTPCFFDLNLRIANINGGQWARAIGFQ